MTSFGQGNVRGLDVYYDLIQASFKCFYDIRLGLCITNLYNENTQIVVPKLENIQNPIKQRHN